MSTVDHWLVSAAVVVGAISTAGATGTADGGESRPRQAVLFVDDDASPGGDGRSWSTAFRHLQDALAAARASEGEVSEIRIGRGTYRPDRDATHPDGTGDRDASFELVDEVELLGGYAGLAGDDPDERDPERHESVLSGDLADDDGPGFVNTGQNSRHVVRIDRNVDSVLDGLVITAGNADGEWSEGRGGGLLCDGGSVQVSQCVFTGNQATGRGGGIFDRGSVGIEDCVFSTNRAADGGGLSSNQSQVIIRSRFVENTATNTGGAIFHRDGSRSEFADCTFTGNQAMAAGGAVYKERGVLTLTRCTFTENHAEFGGALADGYFPGLPPLSTNRMFVLDCSFRENTAVAGGAVYEAGLRWPLGEVVHAGSTFDGNDAALGGAIYIRGGSPSIVKVVVRDNHAALGGAIYNEGGEPVITRSLFEGNDATFDGGVIATRSGDVRVFDSSFTTNTAGREGGVVQAEDSEIGLFGCEISGSAAPDGASVFALRSGLTVADCRFDDNVDGPCLEGEATSASIERTAFSGHGHGPVHLRGGDQRFVSCRFTGTLASSGSAVRLYDASALLFDCEFTDNVGTDGGALRVEGGMSLRVVDCDFRDNTSAVDLRETDVELLGCTFAGNDHGALSVSSSTAMLGACVFTGNSDLGNSGAIGLARADVTAVNCLLTGNSAVHRGGAIGVRHSATLRLIGCTMSRNAAGREHGAIHIEEGSATLINCITWGNGDDAMSDDCEISYSLVEGGWPGEGNVDADPLFVDPLGADGVPGTDDDDLRLQPGSPAIDAGDNDAVPADVTTDLDGNQRFLDDPETPDTGRGEPPLVDLGAFEFPGVTCPADVDGSGAVDAADLVAVLVAWGRCNGCPADLDRNGLVDVRELLVVLRDWGPCPMIQVPFTARPAGASR